MQVYRFEIKTSKLAFENEELFFQYSRLTFRINKTKF